MNKPSDIEVKYNEKYYTSRLNTFPIRKYKRVIKRMEKQIIDYPTLGIQSTDLKRTFQLKFTCDQWLFMITYFYNNKKALHFYSIEFCEYRTDVVTVI